MDTEVYFPSLRRARITNVAAASKTFAEKAAWEFVEKEKPNFTLATMNPPLVFGPIVHYLNSLDSLNTSNQRVRDFMQGKAKDEIPDTGVYIWVDVRDLATGHVAAMEKAEAANKRFFITAPTKFCNKDVIEIIRKNFPAYADKLPSESAPGGRMPDAIFSVDTSQTVNILGLKFRSLEASITDLVKSLQEAGA